MCHFSCRAEQAGGALVQGLPAQRGVRSRMIARYVLGESRQVGEPAGSLGGAGPNRVGGGGRGAGVGR